MRRRRNKRSELVFAAALLFSVLLHAALGIPARSWVNQYLSSGPSKAAPPVRLVSVTPQQWSKNRQLSKARGPRLRPQLAPPPPPKPKKEVKKAKKPKSKLDGQVVEVPPTPDNSPNPDAKYLSKYNSTVKKETVARYDQRDRRRKRVTNKLQDRASTKKSKRNAIKNPIIDVQGDNQDVDKKGAGKGDGKDKGKMAIEIPSVDSKEDVQLKLSDLDGLKQANRKGREKLKGNGREFRLELGGAGDGQQAGGKKGRKDAASQSIPSLESLMPTFGTMARISGSPSSDYVENVPEGEGTFLNTREFKYATFFYRVRDSVGDIWTDMVIRESRRRDPTGNIYGPRDRRTLLSIRLDLDGHLADIRVANSSGVPFLDDVAVQAFKMAEPFPNPPSAMADSDGFISFSFQFVLLRSRGPLNLFR